LILKFFNDPNIKWLSVSKKWSIIETNCIKTYLTMILHCPKILQQNYLNSLTNSLWKKNCRKKSHEKKREDLLLPMWTKFDPKFWLCFFSCFHTSPLCLRFIATIIVKKCTTVHTLRYLKVNRGFQTGVRVQCYIMGSEVVFNTSV